MMWDRDDRLGYGCPSRGISVFLVKRIGNAVSLPAQMAHSARIEEKITATAVCKSNKGLWMNLRP